jgi:hypothetical protein
MKHIQIFEAYTAKGEKLDKVRDLFNILKQKDFRSLDVEDFIFSLDPKEINSFKKKFTEGGIVNKKSFNLLTKYFKNFLDIEFLDQVISSTKEAFETLEYAANYERNPEDQRRVAKELIANKDEILKKLNGLKTRIEKYQQEF